MIYLPNNVTNNNCAYVYDSETIRVYDEIPRYNVTINYTDYFINSHYITRSGSTSFGSYNLPTYSCINYSDFTTNAFYRNDLASILIIAFILIFMCYYFIRTLVRRLLYGRKIF